MIMISSKAGRRLARATDILDQLYERGDVDASVMINALGEFREAAKEVGDELVAGRHHVAEGD